MGLIGKVVCLSGAFACLAGGSVSAAWAGDGTSSSAPAASWIVSVGGMATFGPEFAGSKGLVPGFRPSLSWHRAGDSESFSAPEDGPDFAVYDSKTFKFGATFGFDRGRYHADDPRLNGITDVKWTIQSGIYAEYWPVHDRFRARMEILHGFRDRDGFVMNVSADWVQKYGQFTLSGGPRLSLADHNEMQSRFGISSAEAAASGFSAYNARAGIRSAGVGLAQSYAINPSWTGKLYQHYDRLVGPAGDSPIVTNGGTRNQFTVGAGLTYSFNMGW